MTIIHGILANADHEHVAAPASMIAMIDEQFELFRSSPPTTRAGLENVRASFDAIIAPLNLVALVPIQTWAAVEGGDFLVWFQRGDRHVAFVVREGAAS